MTRLVIDFRNWIGGRVPVCITGAEVEMVESVMYLGVNIRDNLSWAHPYVTSPETLISRFAIQRHQSVGTAWAQDSLQGEHTQLHYSYRVVCSQHYYGEGCSDYCRPRNDTFGHYTCGKEGQRHCLPGWQNEYCSQQHPAKAISERVGHTAVGLESHLGRTGSGWQLCLPERAFTNQSATETSFSCGLPQLDRNSGSRPVPPDPRARPQNSQPDDVPAMPAACLHVGLRFARLDAAWIMATVTNQASA
eukprot:g31617.t1